MKKTTPMSFRPDPDLKAELQRLAEADRRSLTNYIEMILVRHVEEKVRENMAKMAKIAKPLTGPTNHSKKNLDRA